MTERYPEGAAGGHGCLVEGLIEARHARAPFAVEAERLPPTLEAAYAVQARHAAKLATASGARIVGWKLGATSPQTMAALGFSEPFHGPFLSDAVAASPARLARGDFFICLLEAEITFRLGQDMPGRDGGWTAQAAAEAVASAHPSIEIADSRLADPRGADPRAVIADLGAAGALVLGPAIEDWRVLNLAALPGCLRVDGETVSEGLGAATLGGPLQALAWFAQVRAEAGTPLKAGDLVATGAFAPPVPGRAGTVVAADFGPAGFVELTLD